MIMGSFFVVIGGVNFQKTYKSGYNIVGIYEYENLTLLEGVIWRHDIPKFPHPLVFCWLYVFFQYKHWMQTRMCADMLVRKMCVRERREREEDTRCMLGFQVYCGVERWVK